MFIEHAKETDVIEIHQLGLREQYFSISDDRSGFWPEDTVKKMIKSENSLVIVARDHDGIIGFGIANYVPDTRQVLFQNIYTKHAYRQSGIASQIGEFILKEAKELGATYIYCLVDVENSPSLKTMKKLNFCEGHSHFFWLGKTL